MSDSGNFFEALKLLGIGLSTVFLVLILIIQFGKLLIAAVNKFAPEEDEKPKKVAVATAQVAIDPNVQQAIELAVKTITDGKGRVEKIERI
ncbi:MAG: OadG family protein [Bacteroidales bacterium]|nr:OadG family protein [Bacteroidales bacterium]